MQAAVKQGRTTSPKKRTKEAAAKVADKDLANLAAAVEPSSRLELPPPEPQRPHCDPAMWSKLFGIWG